MSLGRSIWWQGRQSAGLDATGGLLHTLGLGGFLPFDVTAILVSNEGQPIALDNFDGLGRWRTTQNDRPIDAAVTLPGGESFDGPAQFKAYLRTEHDLFVRLKALADPVLRFAGFLI